MGENRLISCAEEFEIIYTVSSASMRYNSPLLSVGYTYDFLPSKEYRMERGQRGTFQWRNPKNKSFTAH